MPKKRLSMRKLVEILRLSGTGLSARQISRACGVARSTVGSHLERLAAAGLKWPLCPGMGEEELEGVVFPREPAVRGRHTSRPLPQWEGVRKELSGKGVTLRLLWEEYRQSHSSGYEYSQFCEHYRRWLGDMEVCLRQRYAGGERLFVDFAGMTMPLTDGATGVVHQAQIFVAAWGASHYLYVEALRSQQLHDWIEVHIHAFEHFGGVPALIVPDNLKSAVSRACWYEPDLNPTYQDMALHYGTAVLPARPAKPRDKAKAETGVQIVEREVLAPLRHRSFFSLAEINAAIWERCNGVNVRPFQKLKVCRRALFEELDKPALKPLPDQRYEYAQFRKARVNIDYHIEFERHYYSVPYALKGEQLDVRVTARLVEVLHRGRRVASHLRDGHAGGHTTDSSHMPKAHQQYLAWTPSRIIDWAGNIGPDCGRAVALIIAGRRHPEQGYRAALGIVRLSKGYGDTRVNAACRRAITLDVCAYPSIKSILKTGMDLAPAQDLPTGAPVVYHANVRGADYYAAEGTVAHVE
ncbi:MAG: IS21 family transposase [bacterium]